MKAVGRSMDLNSELVARVHRFVPDTGPSPGFAHMQDEDYDRVTESVLHRASRQRRPLAVRIRLSHVAACL